MESDLALEEKAKAYAKENAIYGASHEALIRAYITGYYEHIKEPNKLLDCSQNLTPPPKKIL